MIINQVISLPFLVDWGVRGWCLRPCGVGFVKSRLPGPVNGRGQPEDEHGPKQTSSAERGHALRLARSHFRGTERYTAKKKKKKKKKKLKRVQLPPRLEISRVSGSKCQTEPGRLEKTRILLGYQTCTSEDFQERSLPLSPSLSVSILSNDPEWTSGKKCLPSSSCACLPVSETWVLSASLSLSLSLSVSLSICSACLRLSVRASSRAFTAAGMKPLL